MNIMKTGIVRCFALVVASVVLCTVVCAHSGGTDSQGGHYNRSTGQYHYHHGYPAHQHTGGVCPYNFDDKTGQSSGTKGGGTQSSGKKAETNDSYADSKSTTETKKVQEKLTWWQIALLAPLFLYLAALILFPVLCAIAAFAWSCLSWIWDFIASIFSREK